MKELIVPNHVGIIMDGNRRWAKEQGKRSIDGHLAGANRIIELAKYIINIKKVNYLSVFAFSTENFGRSEGEVSYLMGLIVKFFKERLNELIESNIKVIFSGRKDPLPKSVQKVIKEVTILTENNTNGTLNVCLNYGSRTEIIDAVNKVVALNKKITEEEFKQFLYHQIPDLDFVIRTSGEQRLSNFMLWQLSYAELEFVKTYFPAFTKEEFETVINDYQNRDRRFGSAKKGKK